MCILFIALKQHPKFPVIICANRDEFHARPTQNMHVWPNEKILAGKDLKAGGTWLGLTSSEHFSALTNFRQPHLIDKNKISRGSLVLRALSDDNKQSNNQLLINHLTKKSENYNGFNLIYGSLDKLYCFDSVNQKKHELKIGVFSICNGAMKDSWPKMADGEKQLNALIHKEEKLNHEMLQRLMTNNTQAADEILPNTGLNKEQEKLLSSIFIKSPNYGTRSTIIITKDNRGNVEITENVYAASGESIKKNTFDLSNSF